MLFSIAICTLCWKFKILTNCHLWEFKKLWNCVNYCIRCIKWMPHLVLLYSAQVAKITQSNSGLNPTRLVAGLTPDSWWLTILAQRYCSLSRANWSWHSAEVLALKIFAKSAALFWPKSAHIWSCSARIWLSAALIGPTQLATWLLMRVAVVLLKLGFCAEYW